jgi:hypothetical protein
MGKTLKKPKLKKLKVKKLKGGGMDRGNASNQSKSASMAGSSSTTSSSGRNPSAQYNNTATLSTKARQDLAAQQKTARETLSPSTKTSSKVAQLIASAVIPGGGLLLANYQDSRPYWQKSKAAQDFKVNTGNDRDGPQQTKSIVPTNPEVKPLFSDTTTPQQQAVSNFMVRPGVSLSSNQLGMSGQMLPKPPTGQFMIRPGVALSDVAKASSGKLIKGKPKLAKKGWK